MRGNFGLKLRNSPKMLMQMRKANREKGYFQKKRSCTAKLPATAETKRVQKSSKFFYSPGPEFAPKKNHSYTTLRCQKKN